MNHFINMTCITGVLIASAIGCAATSAEEQRRAVTHQHNADEAAHQGQYGMASDEQRKAEEAHARAVKKAMDEGKPIPRQTRPGDPPPPPPPAY
ncbi:hypothetical protein [Sorangium sp. So ce388]|uniref:Uncharacterized protein n=1 Tax=Sorangium cellulosum TaxID=56 RepID=A0A150S5S6_SORCE|nr:hypothetical protein BE17_36600 [Sorangium cellulosum]